MNLSEWGEISSLAVVHPAAQIDSGVRIDPFVVVEADVVIGAHTHIHAHAHIRSGSRIGQYCEVYTGACIAVEPQDLKYGGESTVAVIGNETVVREYATISKGTAATGRTVIGRKCLLMAYSHVGHDARVGDNVILSNSVQLGGHVHIDDWAVLGGLSGVHQYNRVGKHAMIGAGLRVVKDVPPFALAGNDPLGYSGVNVVGLRRRGFSEETIRVIRDAYRKIYLSGLNVSDGVDLLSQRVDKNPFISEIVSFVEKSERGIIPLSR